MNNGNLNSNTITNINLPSTDENFSCTRLLATIIEF